MMTNKEQLLENLNHALELQRNRVQKIRSLLSQQKYDGSIELENDFRKIEDVFSEAEKLYNKFKNTTEDNWEVIKEDAVEVFNVLKNSLNQLIDKFPKEDLEGMKDEVINSFNQAIEATETYIRHNPLPAVLYSFAIGFLLGKLMK